jgi:predicted nucleotidyltransferase
MERNILSIILYGSHARKDHDESSDYDICVITRERKNEELTIKELEEAIGPLEQSTANIVCYPEAVLESMLAHGSLFLWHLKLEGKVLFGAQYLNDKLHGLARFKTHYEEIKYHAELFQDLKRSWALLSFVNELDLSLLFTIVRNTCMVLAHRAGKPSFGRVASFHSAKDSYPNLPITFDQYLYLSRWKLLYEREIRPSMTLPNSDDFRKVLFAIDNFLQFAIEEVVQNA